MIVLIDSGACFSSLSFIHPSFLSPLGIYWTRTITHCFGQPHVSSPISWFGEMSSSFLGMGHPHCCHSNGFLLPTRPNNMSDRRVGSTLWRLDLSHHSQTLILGEVPSPSLAPMTDIYWAALSTDSLSATSMCSLYVLWKPWIDQLGLYFPHFALYPLL